MPKQKVTLKKIPISEDFPVLKKIPYRVFYGMPEKFIGVPMFFSYYFNIIAIIDLLTVFLKFFMNNFKIV